MTQTDKQPSGIGRVLERLRRQLPAPIAELMSAGVLQNASNLLVIHVATYLLLPIVTVHYLARVLGAEGTGLVAIFQSLGNYTILLVEYGFNLSATREAARVRGDAKALSSLLISVMTAKAVLAMPAMLAAILATTAIPALHNHPGLLIGSMLYALGISTNVNWFYQGIERVRIATCCDLVSKLLGTATIVFVVKSPDDAHLALAVPGMFMLLATTTATLIAYRNMPLVRPNRRDVLTVLRGGWSIFVMRGMSNVFSNGSLVLSLFTTPRYVGYFAGAERIYKALLGLLYPLSQAVFPRLAHLVHHDREAAQQFARASMKITGAASCCLSVATFALAPQMVSGLLGPDFQPAIVILRILSVLPVFRSITEVFGIQWLVPLGRESVFNRVMLVAAAVLLISASLLVPHYQHNGMAVCVLLAEATLATGIVLSLYRIRQLPGQMPERARLPQQGSESKGVASDANRESIASAC